MAERAQGGALNHKKMEKRSNKRGLKEAGRLNEREEESWGRN